MLYLTEKLDISVMFLQSNLISKEDIFSYEANVLTQ